MPPKPLIAPKPSVAARLTCAKSVSSTSLPPTSLESHPSNPSLLSQSAPQSPLNNPLVGPRTDPRDRDASDNSSCSEMITSFSEPVVATPIEAHSPSSQSHPVGLGRAAHGVSGTAGFKGAAPLAQTHLSQPPASTQQAKAVLRQHGGPGSSVSKNSTIIKAVDEPPPDPATCEVKPGKETTIEVNKDKLGLGLSIVGGSDTLLVRPLLTAAVDCAPSFGSCGLPAPPDCCLSPHFRSLPSYLGRHPHPRSVPRRRCRPRRPLEAGRSDSRSQRRKLPQHHTQPSPGRLKANSSQGKGQSRRFIRGREPLIIHSSRSHLILCIIWVVFGRLQVKMMVYRDETSSKDDDMLDIIEVELLKKPGRGLGLSIVGRRNGPGVYISDVVS